jgi:hypothetical protein
MTKLKNVAAQRRFQKHGTSCFLNNMLFKAVGGMPAVRNIFFPPPENGAERITGFL